MWRYEGTISICGVITKNPGPEDPVFRGEKNPAFDQECGTFNQLDQVFQKQLSLEAVEPMLHQQKLQQTVRLLLTT